ncbi:MAG: ring-cleaving dioxygenase [Xanthobacteraceae bacterium]
MTRSAGIHHVTAICSNPRRNVAFYTDGLGLRMVKRTVNFDDPSTWHLYYGDETGSPGTALTFFAWGNLPPGHNGIGQTVATAFMIPERSLAYWTGRFAEKGIPHDGPARRFDQTFVALRDPDGMSLELVATKGARALPAWSGGPVPAEHAIRGFSGVRLLVGEAEPTAQVLTEALGFASQGQENSRHRFVAADGPLGTIVDLRAESGAPPGRQGAGSVHHVAFRAPDDDAELEMASAVRGLGLRPTDPIDRQYFHSVYFREPGGVLFEIATDGPGFTVDEPKEALGSSLKLPAWIEPRRAQIEAALPALA